MRWKHWLGLWAIVAFHAWLDLHFLSADGSVPYEDAPVRLIMAAQHYYGGVNTTHGFPPLTFAWTAWCLDLWGPTIEVALRSMVVWRALFVLGCAWIGWSLAGRRGLFLLAFAGAGMPWFTVYGRSYFTDVPMSAMVALTWGALLASRSYTRPVPTVILGLCAGLGMLARWSFAFFVVGPLLIAAVGAFRQDRVTRRALWVSVGAVGLTVVLLAFAGTALARPGTASLLTRWFGSQGQPPRQESIELAVLVLIYGGWAALVAAFRRHRHHPREHGLWNTGAGVGIAGGIALAAMSWWYVPAADRILTKASQEAGLRGQSVDGLRVLTNLNNLAAGWWLLPELVLIGILVALVARDLRRPTWMALAGVGIGGAITTVMAPHAPRYLLPGVVFLLAVGFGWLGRSRRIGAAATAATALIGFYQVGWWVLPEFLQPGGSPIVGLFQPGKPPEFSILTATRLRMTPTPRSPLPQLRIPVSTGPVLEDWSIRPALDAAVQRGRQVAVFADRSEATSTMVLDTYAFGAEAALAGLDLDVVDQYEQVAREAFQVIVVAGRELSETSPPELPFPGPLREVSCWHSEPRDRSAPSSYWCLYDNFGSRMRGTGAFGMRAGGPPSGGGMQPGGPQPQGGMQQPGMQQRPGMQQQPGTWQQPGMQPQQPGMQPQQPGMQPQQPGMQPQQPGMQPQQPGMQPQQPGMQPQQQGMVPQGGMQPQPR